jgi:hypothetical protein
MKLTFIISILFASMAFAQDVATTAGENRTTNSVNSNVNQTKTDDIGVGISVGGPIVVTGKYWLSEANALDFGMALNKNDYAILGTYLYHFEMNANTVASRRMAPYVGAGFYLDPNEEQDRNVFSNDRDTDNDKGDEVGFGLRIPVGIEYLPTEVPMGLFAEITPGLALTPTADGFVNVSAGGRYYF